MDIKTWRGTVGLSQTDLAEELGVNQATLSSWEVGRTKPSITMCRRLSRVTEGCVGVIDYHPEEYRAAVDDFLEYARENEDVMERVVKWGSAEQLTDRQHVWQQEHLEVFWDFKKMTRNAFYLWQRSSHVPKKVRDTFGWNAKTEPALYWCKDYDRVMRIVDDTHRYYYYHSVYLGGPRWDLGEWGPTEDERKAAEEARAKDPEGANYDTDALLPKPTWGQLFANRMKNRRRSKMVKAIDAALKEDENND